MYSEPLTQLAQYQNGARVLQRALTVYCLPNGKGVFPRVHPPALADWPAESAAAAPIMIGSQSTRVAILALACLAAGLAGSAFWARQARLRQAEQAASETQPDGAPPLSAATVRVLQGLKTPLTVRFYCSLDPAGAPASMPAFAGRVERLLDQFEREAGGKLKVERHNFESDSALRKAAIADGIKPFSMETDEACFLGIAIAGKRRTETLERLAPEWEPAVEFDLARAIERAAAADAQAPPSMAPPRQDPAVLDEVRRLIPNVESVSVEEGTRLLRQAALADSARAAQQIGARIQEARQRLAQAQSNHSETDRQAAMKQLQQAQAEQNDTLSQIAARSAAQVQALTRLKTGAH